MTSQTIASDLPPPPNNPSGHAPPRRPASARRTSSLDMSWPDGEYGTPMRVEGRARDILTPLAGGDARLMTEDLLLSVIDSERTIIEIAATPPRPGIEGLVGVRGGGYLRQALADVLPGERRAGTPLSLLIDDLSGGSLVAGWAWSQWRDDWLPREYASGDKEEARRMRHERMHSICIGFRPGSSALDDLYGKYQNSTPVPGLANPQDPQGWHPMPEYATPSLRRARRIDVWRDHFKDEPTRGGLIHIDAMFQDSATTPHGGRTAIHEYCVRATADPQTLTLTSLVADPRTLPYPECPSAVGNVGRLVGTPLADLRHEVLDKLRRVDGCTHLNDVLRALAEVPVLVGYLDQA